MDIFWKSESLKVVYGYPYVLQSFGNQKPKNLTPTSS